MGRLACGFVLGVVVTIGALFARQVQIVMERTRG
jgi:hypothetical protein